MKATLLSLGLLAAAGVPAACATRPTTPYFVNLNLPPGPNEPGFTLHYNDVLDVHGLPVATLLNHVHGTPPFPVEPRHGRPQFAYVRAWGGETALNSLLGVVPPAPGGSAELGLNADSSYQLTLGDPRVDYWQLFAENGVIVTESVQFSYNSIQITPVQRIGGF
jgi:hypothetical protein